MKVGDHLVSRRTGYTHHGIYIGHDQVIHYSGFADGISSGQIEVAALDEFSKGKAVRIKKHLDRTYGPRQSVARARSRLGEDWYNVLANNCEHFVNWCINGDHSSSQVNLLIAAVAGVSAAKSLRAAKVARQSAKAIATMVKSRRTAEVGRQTGTAIAHVVSRAGAKSAVSSSAGTLAGLATGAGMASGAGGATTGLVVGLSAASAAPAVAAVAAAAVVGYGVKKAIDWIWD